MRFIWLLTVMAVTVFGCMPAPAGGGGGPHSGPERSEPLLPSQASTTIVVARDMSFSPPTVTIPVGGTVVWRFEGPSPHSSTSDAGAPQQWDSGILGPGATYAVRFDRPGTYPYHCTPHAALGMRGTVVVQ